MDTKLQKMLTFKGVLPADNFIPISELLIILTGTPFKTLGLELKKMILVDKIPKDMLSEDGKEISLWCLLYIVSWRLNEIKSAVSAELENADEVEKRKSLIKANNSKAELNKASIAKINKEYILVKDVEKIITGFKAIIADISGMPKLTAEQKDDYSKIAGELISECLKR